MRVRQWNSKYQLSLMELSFASMGMVKTGCTLDQKYSTTQVPDNRHNKKRGDDRSKARRQGDKEMDNFRRRSIEGKKKK